ncbi:MAG TPA: methionine aminotransferase [Bacteroidia bacterium]|jgi:methionine aminotransferase|nr:methionine aminotransferase [Bacteroidia bacterium]
MNMIKYNGVINSKLPAVGTTIFTIMSKLAQEQNAINLSQGFPDFNCSDKLVNLVSDYMKKGFNQYPPMQGAMPLRERISEMVEGLYGTSYSPDSEITITAGATQAIYTAISAFVREGDEVIVFEPAYDCYVPAIEMNGGKPIFVKLKQPDFSIDWQMVKKLVNHHTRMIIINTPHNPSGAVFKENDLKELEKLTRDTDVIVLSDEVYEHMYFNDTKHWSVVRSKFLAERSVLVSSFGKTVHTTGWKIGYVAAPANLMTEFRKVHQFLVFAVNHPIQMALAEFLKEKDNYSEVKNFYKQKRDLFAKLISGSRFSFEPSAGTYFQLLKYDAISKEKDTDFAIRLTKEHKIASVPLSVFYHLPEDNNFLRFCFAKKDETLEKAAEILCKL